MFGRKHDEEAKEEARGAAQEGAQEGTSLEELQRERDDFLARLLRAQADYQNLKRRTQGEIEGEVRRSLEPLLRSMMLALDHLDLALGAPLAGEEAKTLAEGVRLTRDQMLQALHQQGVEPIPAGESFDPSVHEAVTSVERADLPEGSIVDVLRPGYSWRGQVLRFAQVRVSHGGPARARQAQAQTQAQEAPEAEERS